MSRRDFIGAAPCGALLTGALPSVSHAAAENRPPIPGLPGMLYDSTLCAGCQAYVIRCQDINPPERNPQGEQTWSNNDKLSPYTNNTIWVWTSGTGVDRDQGENGYTYIKKQYVHCVDPNCISVRSVSALKKDPKTGIIHYDKDMCTGCRYCMVAYPYNVLRYGYNSPSSALRKCELCNQRGAERLDKGGLSGCVEIYPASAVIFGICEELMVEAKKHLALKLGSRYHHPRQTLKSGDTHLRTVPRYYPHLYGEKKGGGIQVLVLTGAPYGSLDLPRLDDLSTGAHSEHVQHTLYKDMMLPLAVLADLTVLVRRNTRNDHHDGGDDHEL